MYSGLGRRLPCVSKKLVYLNWFRQRLSTRPLVSCQTGKAKLAHELSGDERHSSTPPKATGVTGLGLSFPWVIGEKGGWNVRDAQHNLMTRSQDGGSMLLVLFPGLGSVDSSCRTAGSIPREGAVTHGEEWAANVMKSTAEYCSGSLVSRGRMREGLSHTGVARSRSDVEIEESVELCDESA